MSHVLIILTPARRADSLLEEALAAAGPGGRLTAIYLEDTYRSEHLRDCLARRGFVGKGPADDIGRLMDETAHEAGADRLLEVTERARAAGCECETHIVRGPFGETVLQLVERHGPDRVYLGKSRLGPLAFFFGERDLRLLKRQLGSTLVTVTGDPAS